MRASGLSIALACLAIVGAAPATAAEMASPKIAAPPTWVTPEPIPDASAKVADRPLQVLLVDAQSHYGKEASAEYFFQLATKVQSSQGLSALGNIVIPWQPDNSELLIHRVSLIRDGKTIDLLGKGESLTVLRRESNLESAMLDGVLTAVLQPEGLAVGDIVNVAWTIRTKPRQIALRAENLVVLSPPPFFARRAFYRETWDKGVPIRWRATPSMGKPQLRNQAGGTELVFDLTDATGPKPPESAPARFQLAATLELSSYQDWAEIGRLFAPLYAKATQLAPDSPLHGEIDRIASASPDPQARAMAALRLVEDKVRYLALSMGDAGYVPANADQTWSRKFGDCKGKTVLLLSLLSGLGIEAEPVLVSSELGDTLPDRLPVVRLFDHVIVRARIAGKTYWLDGTRIGDRRIEDLTSSSFGWGLPVTPAGSGLEKLPLLPPALPLQETRITYDASNGFEAPVPTSGEVLFRGDTATVLGLAMAQGSRQQLIDYLKDQTRSTTGIDGIDTFDVKHDDAAGTITFLFSGKVRMDWSKAPGSSALRFRFDDDVIQWSPKFDRAADETQRDAPFVFAFPAYLTETETIILPKSGAGFTLQGHDLARTVAGVEIRRTLSLASGRAVARSSFRRLQRELPAVEARAADTALKEVNADRAYILSPAGYRPSEAERNAAVTVAAKTADEHVQRGFNYLQLGRPIDALTEFDAAIALSPNWSRPYSDKGIALLHLGRKEEAKAALDKAASLADNDFVTWQGYGVLALFQNRPLEAADALTRSLALDAENSFSLARRAEAYEQLGRFDEAAADLATLTRVSPDPAPVLGEQARLAAFRNQGPEAVALADRWIAGQPNDAKPLAFKGTLLKMLGRSDDAGPVFADALAKLDIQAASAKSDEREELRVLRADILAESGRTQDALAIVDLLVREHPVSLRYLNQRCLLRATANIELPLALMDCDKAMKLNPSAAVLDSRGLVKLRLGRFDEAIADYDEATRRVPTLATSFYGRGIARLRKGDKENGEADLATARRLSFDIDARFKAWGIAP